MQQPIVRVEHLWHRYSQHWAIQDIDFTIDQKGVLGLLGSNGAGKSTTMNIMCGVLNQTQGNVFIDGINMAEAPQRAKQLIGFLPQQAPLHIDLTVDEYLIHCAHMRLMDKNKIRHALAAVKSKCGIAHFSKRLLRNLSGGYKQRVGIAQAIMHEPKLVVLDEPTNGPDPNQITAVRQLIKEIAEERAVIFSSHILSEVQATCQYIKMIENGKMVFSGSMEEFNNYVAPTTIFLTIEEPPLLEELTAIDGITHAERINGNYSRLRFNADHTITEKIIRHSVLNNWRLREIHFEKTSLEEIFAQLSIRNNN